MDRIMDMLALAGGFLLAATLIWVGSYNFRRKEVRKGLLFALSGAAIGLILIYGILTNH